VPATNVDYLRISLTDRCNLRCLYCNPTGSGHLTDSGRVLNFEEIRRAVGLFARSGFRRVRLTGGEPLVREGVVELVKALAGTPGIKEVTLTTNGVLLSALAGALKKAGLNQVNVSLDAATRACYTRITGSDRLAHVLEGIHTALAVGLAPVKINAVVMKDINVAEIAALARMSLALPLLVRFIEYCPTDRRTQRVDLYVPNGEVRRLIENEFGPLVPLVLGRGGGPAVYFKIRDSAGAVGFISGRSSMFCGRCNRLRLSHEGHIRPCLYSSRAYDMGRLLREGAADEPILSLIEEALREKHRHTRLSAADESFSMQSIGG
jgi:cyclic pyranopterin phosphate synthase